MKCIAIDDEPLALNIIQEYCNRLSDIELETYSSPLSGMERIRQWKPEVVLLDIEMNGVSGMELAHKIPSDCALIFTTAYAQYALEGFEVNAVDFLHKPFFFQRFEKAISKAREWLKMKDLLKVSRSEARQLMLKSDYKTVGIPIDSIVYVESFDNYVKVHLSDLSEISSKTSLKSIEEQLEPKDFLRIHRSYLISLRRLSSFNRSEVGLEKDRIQLPIGKKYLTEVLYALKGTE